MNPAYAIATRTFEPIDLDVLTNALRGVPGLTPADAPTVCGEGYGFLARHLSAEQATAFHANLQRARVAAEIVSEASIPALPTRRLIRRAEFSPEALVVDDPLGRMTPVAWSDLVLIAAGSVRELVYSQIPYECAEVHFGKPVRLVKSIEEETKESVEWLLRAELLLADDQTRLSIEPEKLSFAGLQDRLTQDLATNFCLLIRELGKHAPQAVLNQGALRISAEPWEFAYYKTRRAFQDETTWLLWRRTIGETSRIT